MQRVSSPAEDSNSSDSSYHSQPISVDIDADYAEVQKTENEGEIDDDEIDDERRAVEEHDTAVNKAIDSFKKAIRQKPGWSHKIFNEEITERYSKEAAAQGMREEDVLIAVQELQDFATQQVDSEKVTYSDSCIPEELRVAFEKQLDRLVCRPPNGEPDWHPGSSEKVLDLIHPSLYCYVEGVSKIYPKSPYDMPKFASKADRENMTKHAEKVYKEWLPKGGFIRYNRKFETSKGGYQWLPATYDIDASGRSRITSYINNLDRNKYSDLYESFARGFDCVLPLMEKVTGTKLKNKKLQVITKACNYVLRPGQTHQGVWHVEGMPSEMIIASAIFYYSSSPHLEDDGLAFRRERDEQRDFPTWYDYEQNRPPAGGFRNWRQNIELGAVPTVQGRAVVFGNEMQHCVTLLYNPSKTEVAYRKIVCWFLVNPAVQIISTEDVPPQQWDHAIRLPGVTLILIVRRLLQGISLPRDILLKILFYSHEGMTLSEARVHRAALMKERKVFINRDNKEMERDPAIGSTDSVRFKYFRIFLAMIPRTVPQLYRDCLRASRQMADLQNGNKKVMQAVVQRKFRANQFETDPEKIEKFKGEAFKSLNTIFKMLLSQEVNKMNAQLQAREATETPKKQTKPSMPPKKTFAYETDD